MRQYLRKIPNGLKFFLAVISLYTIIYFSRPELALEAFHSFLGTFLQVLPILLMVFFMIFLSYIFVKPAIVRRHLGHDSGLKGWIYTIFGSMLIAGPPYVLFPLLGELREHGMKYSLIATFMNNRNVQPAFLPVIAYYFGWQFSLVFGGYVLLFAISSGMLMERIMQEKNTFSDRMK